MDLKRKDKVIDPGFPRWRTGDVVKVLKSTVHVQYPNRSDEAHFSGDKDGIKQYSTNEARYLQKVKG